MKNYKYFSAKAMKIAGFSLLVIFICTGVQAQENILSLAVPIRNALESSVFLNLFSKFLFAALGMSPVVCLLNYAASKTGMDRRS
jgi:hypothetical protein